MNTLVTMYVKTGRKEDKIFGIVPIGAFVIQNIKIEELTAIMKENKFVYCASTMQSTDDANLYDSPQMVMNPFYSSDAFDQNFILTVERKVQDIHIDD